MTRHLAILAVALVVGCAEKPESNMNLLNAIGRAKGYGGCYKCGTTWNRVEGHSTPYEFYPDGRWCRSCFPLCEPCWASLTPETRLPYYEQMGRNWFRFCGSAREHWRLVRPKERPPPLIGGLPVRRSVKGGT